MSYAIAKTTRVIVIWQYFAFASLLDCVHEFIALIGLHETFSCEDSNCSVSDFCCSCPLWFKPKLELGMGCGRNQASMIRLEKFEPTLEFELHYEPEFEFEAEMWKYDWWFHSWPAVIFRGNFTFAGHLFHESRLSINKMGAFSLYMSLKLKLSRSLSPSLCLRLGKLSAYTWA